MPKIESLTEQEKRILRFASTGLTDKEIAVRLSIGRGTLITHWARMKAKLQSANRGEMIAHLIRHEMTSSLQSDSAIGEDLSGLEQIPDVDLIPR